MNLRAAWKALFSSGKIPPPTSGYGRGYGLGAQALNRLLPGAKLDYARDAGDRWRNVPVAACLRWLCENAGQACLVAKEEEVGEEQENADEAKGKGKAAATEKKARVIEGDPIVAMIETPNPFMTMEELVSAFLMSDRVDGNSYFLLANGSGGVGSPTEIWWAPWWMMGPYTAESSEKFIDGYWYQPGNGQTYILSPDQVVHVKNGLDPYDQRFGCSALKASGDRSIVGINDCETYTVAVVRNGGPLRLFIPDAPDLDMDDAKAEGIKGKIRRGTRGENAASVEVLNEPGRVEQVGAGPQELALDTLPNRMESNICSLMGVDAQVAGLAAGQGTRTFDNYGEAEGHAWKNSLIPSLKRFASAFTKRFMDGTGRWLEWDYSEVKALAEDEGEKIAQVVAAVGGPVMTVDEGRARLGLPPATPAQMEEMRPPAPEMGDPNADPNAEMDDEGEDGDDPFDGSAASEDETLTAESLGLPQEDFDLLTQEDLDDLLAKPKGKAVKARSSRRAKQRAPQPSKPGSRRRSSDKPPVDRDRDGLVHDGRSNEGPAPGRSGDKPKQPRHVRLAARAAVAQKRHEKLKHRGEKDPAYLRALDRAIRIKQASHKARQARAKKLVERRKKVAARRAKPTPEHTTEASRKAGFIGEIPAKEVHFDPVRFQYKMAVTDSHTGSVGSLAGVKKWDPELAGVISVWKDPASGKTFVVNGHNRLDLANKLGVEKVAVRYLDAPDAQHARAKGALANIAEGRGTSMDAAKFFRDSGIKSRADLQSRGIPLTEAKTSEGLALSGLTSPLFRRAIDGSLPVDKAAIIGGGGLHDSQQMQIASLYDKQKGKVSGGQLREMVDEAKASGVRQKQQSSSMFGGDDGPDEESLFLHRTALNAHVKERLSREKKLFGTVSRQRSADQLAQAGNVIDAAASGKVSRDAGEALNVFDSLKRTSVFSGATNAASLRIAEAKNEGERKRARDDYYEEVKRRVKNAYDLGN